MRSLKITLSYDGTDYSGWQVQPGARTVQAAVEAALQQVTGARVRVAASGRTDAGVHALGQVVSLATESRLAGGTLERACNATLPRDIAVHAVEEAPGDFHARRDAVQKRYEYRIHNHPVADVFRRRYTWHVAAPLDVDAMARAAQGLTGEHDFCGFEATGAPRKTTVRTVRELTVGQGRGAAEDEIRIAIQANGFLYKMVRNIVGTLVEVGRGARAESWPIEVLAGRDRRRGGPTAPAQGLFLVRVEYRGRKVEG
ncbi:MAG: tRNA pseudouridine(38-40) synthase TruA [Planctomycetia bacterium]|nr:MAG: tRNA pseudouridine(38-40) synthase TruA [Planctomycetia bacterium]